MNRVSGIFGAIMKVETFASSESWKEKEEKVPLRNTQRSNGKNFPSLIEYINLQIQQKQI